MDITTLGLSTAEFERTLDGLYTQMLPLTAQFVNLARAIGGLAALIYISSKVWGHLARAEPIDIFPLLRPFAIGLAILLFIPLCSGLRGITGALSHGTDTLRDAQTAQINALQAQKDAAIANSPSMSDFATDEAMEKKIDQLGGATGLNNLGAQTSLRFQRIQYEIGQSFREWLKNILQLGNMAARLGLSLVATLLLVLLSVIGPIAFAVAIFPGFGGGIQKWLGHFITISLWVPVANIFSMVFGQIQVVMLNADIARISAGGTPDTADIGYLCFLVLCIAGYLFVPKGTDMLLDVSGASGVATSFMQSASGYSGAAGASGGAGVRGAAGAMGTVVGAGQGLAGMATAANATRGESLGHRLGSALNQRINRPRS